jgi:hypothetical protein
MTTDSDSPRVIRVAPATVAIFAVVFCPLLLTATLLISRGQQIPHALGLCAAYIGVVGWFCSPSIELSPNRLAYRTILRRRSIVLSEVVRVSTSANPAPTIAFKQNRRAGRPLAFIVKPFSKRGVTAMLQHVREYSPQAQFDRIAADMAAGDFHSITKETISSRNLLRIAIVAAVAVFGTAIARMLLHH